MNKVLSWIGQVHTQTWVYATVLVAYFFRVYRLADKNIWWDEGWSLWLARQDPLWIALRTASDEHPPLHYWMLRVWGALTDTLALGPNATYAGRWLSVAFGVLTIALIYRIGKRVGGEWIGVLAAGLLALARFNIWWSQDVKNYTPSIFFAFAAVWFALVLLDKPSWKAIVGYGVCAALAVWTHYLAALIPVALNVYAAYVFVRRYLGSRFGGSRPPLGVPSSRPPTPDMGAQSQRSSFARSSFVIYSWLLAQILAAALFAPWMYIYLKNAAAWTAAPAFDFGIFLELVATVLPLGVTTEIERYMGLMLAFTALAALGAIYGARAITGQAEQRPAGAGLPDAKTDGRSGALGGRGPGLFTIAVLLPPVLIYLLSLTPVSFFAPKIQARYLLILLPAYVLLLAFGILALRRFHRAVAAAALLAIVVADVWTLQGYYGERRLADEYTTLANTINAFARPGDLVFLDTDQEWPTFLSYLRAPLDWMGAPNGAPMQDGLADTLVQSARARHDAVWVVVIPDALATDPQRLVESRLARVLPRQFEQTFGDKRLALYAPEPRNLASVPPENFQPQNARTLPLDGSLQLLGFDLPVREARTGDTVRVVTYWNATKPAEVPLELRALASGTAHVPQGERVRAQTDFVIPPNAMGTADLAMGTVDLGQVRVEPRPSAGPAGAIAHPLDVRLDAIHLAGYDLPETRFRAGASVPVTLYWRADRPLTASYVVFVHLLGTTFNPAHQPPNPLWGQVDRIPREGTFPTTAWRPGETIADAYRVPIEAGAPAGRYKIEVGLYDPATGARLVSGEGQDSIVIAEVDVVAP